MGEVARRLDITVSAGEQTYTLQALRDLIDAGVRMVQPDISTNVSLSSSVWASSKPLIKSRMLPGRTEGISPSFAFRL